MHFLWIFIASVLLIPGLLSIEQNLLDYYENLIVNEFNKARNYKMDKDASQFRVDGIGKQEIGINPELVDYYENLVKSEVAKAKMYKLDEDARRYRVNKGFKKGLFCCGKVFGEFDFIVIGAGSTGTVIANRLSEIPEWDVLLLEAGGYENNFTEIPVMTTISTLSDYNWGFKTVSQKGACLAMENNVCPYPRGRGLGGTTIINGLAYSRGNAKGYDILGSDNSGWSYKEVLPYFLKSENLQVTDTDVVVDYDYHYAGGPLDVKYHIPGSKELPNYLQANIELGFNITDLNSPGTVGVSKAPMNIRRGRRFSGYRAFLEPITERKNLKILPFSYVTKLIINNRKRVTGVKFNRLGKSYKAKVRKEVIVSGGTVSSPQILMLSGIGPEDHLKELNIPVIQNLSVGKNLVDHVGVSIYFSTNIPVEHYTLREHVINYLVGIGAYAAPGPNDAFGFYQTRFEKNPNYPDLEIILVPNYGNVTDDFSQQTLNLRSENLQGYIPSNDSQRIIRIDLFELHSKSRGIIKLKTNSPYDYPLIDPNCLSDERNRDIDTIYEGIQLVLKLMNTTAMREIETTLQPIDLPACRGLTYLSKEYWYCIIRQVGHPVNHPFGTCSMGSNPEKGAVVDNNLKVHGIQNLRVADASVFPFALTGHPNAPCVMVGEKVSDAIKNQYNRIH